MFYAGYLNLSLSITIIGLSEKIKHVLGVYYPYFEIKNNLLQHFLLEFETTSSSHYSLQM